MSLPLWKRGIYRFFGKYDDPDICSYSGTPYQEAFHYIQHTLVLFFSEFFGSFALIFCITGIRIANEYAKKFYDLETSPYEVELVAISVITGFLMCGLIYSFGGTSGLCFLKTLIFKVLISILV